jgi:hypothetical protein
MAASTSRGRKSPAPMQPNYDGPFGSAVGGSSCDNVALQDYPLERRARLRFSFCRAGSVTEGTMGRLRFSFCRAGRVGGNHGHASLRLPGNGSGSFHGHRNGPCDAPAIGAVDSSTKWLAFRIG